MIDNAPTKTVDYDALLDVGRNLLVAIGENPDRPGLLDTPRRFASLWREFIEYDPGTTDTVFEQTSVDQMVVISGMRVWSYCEHHLVPFWCDISIAYIAGAKVLGLSKFGRVAHQYAHRLQLQEQLVSQVADAIQEITETENVAVIGSGEHLCMSMRGIKTPALMSSSVTRGLFRDDARTREELFNLLALSRKTR